MMRQTIATAAVLAALSTLPAVPAVAAEPDGGTIKVHSAGVPAADARDEKKVCRFYLAAEGFDGTEELRYRLTRNSSVSRVSVSGAIWLREGSGVSGNIRVPDGPYTLTWSSGNASTTLGSKDLTVACNPAAPQSGTAPAPSGTSGGTNPQAATTDLLAGEAPEPPSTGTTGQTVTSQSSPEDEAAALDALETLLPILKLPRH